MQFRWLAVCAIALAALESICRAEQIRFSQPLVGLATPARAEEEVRAASSRRLRLETPAIAAPAPMMLPEPTIIIRRERIEDEDDEKEDRDRSTTRKRSYRDHLLSRQEKRSDWAKEQKQNDFEPPLGNGAFPFDRTDSDRGLAPVRDMKWDGREGSDRNDLVFGKSSALDRDEREVDSFSMFSRENGDGKAEGGFLGRGGLADVFGRRGQRESEKKELSSAALERRAAFEQMLNSSVGPAGRMSGSLDPLPSPGLGAPAPVVAMTPVARPRVEVKAGDPTQLFNQRQDRLRGSPVSSPNSAYTQPRPSVTGPGAYGSQFQTPLNRQPIARELPSRRF